MSSSKASATQPAKDNMLDFTAGEAEAFLMACTARVHARQLREIKKDYLELATLFEEEDWLAVSAALRNRTPEHMRIFYRKNRDHIVDYFNKMPPTPPGSGNNSPKGQKRGRKSDDDESSHNTPNKRQTTESNSPKARRTNGSTLLPSSNSASAKSEATRPREQSTSASNSPDSSLTVGDSTVQEAAVDSARQAKSGEIEEQNDSVAEAGDVAKVTQLEAQLKLIKEQLVRSKKQHTDEIAALKKEHKLELDAKTAEVNHKEYQILGLENRVQKLENDEDEVKRHARKDAANARERAEKKMKEADMRVKVVNEKARHQISKAKEEAKEDVSRVQKQLDHSNKLAEDQLKAVMDEWHKNEELQKALDEKIQSFANLRSQFNKLQERAGLERNGQPKDKQRLAFYGPIPTKPDQAPLYTQHAVNHACERYFMQMSRDYFKADKGNWSRFLDKLHGMYKRHGFPVPVYFGGGEKKELQTEVSW